MGSALFHALLALGAFYLIFAQKKIEKLEIQVLEYPVVTPKALPPPPLAKPKEKRPAPRVQPVFGISKNTLRSETGPEIKAGNSVALAPDQKIIPLEDAIALPIPADEVEVTEMPRLLSEVRIPYPQSAKDHGIQGVVVMDLLIDDTGAVREAKLIEGPGEGLNEAALEAMKKFRFTSAKIDARKVAVRIRYASRFVLEH